VTRTQAASKHQQQLRMHREGSEAIDKFSFSYIINVYTNIKILRIKEDLYGKGEV
jgi:hypothetical protein